MMNINILIICITILIAFGISAYLYYKFTNKRQSQKDFELELEKYKFFASVDTKAIKDEIDNLVNQYFSYYVLYNFEAYHKDYIKKDEMDKGIRDITKNIVIEMSELYSFYFRMIYNIDTEEQMTSKVFELVTDTMIAYASDYNKPKEGKE